MRKLIGKSQIRAIQTDILKYVDAFCRENHIQYFLAGGTLLGAVRHQGYIPWDDDIDIAMPREDYMRFIEIFDGSNADLEVLSSHKDPAFPYTFAKVSNRNTCLVENTRLQYPMGVNIDVFPIDGLPDDIETSNKHFSQIQFYRNVLILKGLNPGKGRKFIKEVFIHFVRLCTFCVQYRYLVRRINQIAMKYSYRDCKYAAVTVHGYGKRERVEKSIFNQTEEMLFEGKYFRVPVGYDQWLSALYGEYMKLPPEDKRVTHHDFTVYWKE
jgi:lipopolysaccharide cholinephosphotransferase